MEFRDSGDSETPLEETTDQDGGVSKLIELARDYVSKGFWDSAWKLLEAFENPYSVDARSLRAELWILDLKSAMERDPSLVKRFEGTVYTEEYDLFARGVIRLASIKTPFEPAYWAGECEIVGNHALPLAVVEHHPLDVYIGLDSRFNEIGSVRLQNVRELGSSYPIVEFTGSAIPDYREEYESISRKLNRFQGRDDSGRSRRKAGRTGH